MSVHNLEANPDRISVRNANFLYTPTLYPSEMLNFASKSNPREAAFGGWRSLDPHQNNDNWMAVNYAADQSSSLGREIDHKPNFGYDEDDAVTLASYGTQGLDLASYQERLKEIYGQGQGLVLLPESSMANDDHASIASQALSLSLSSNPPRNLHESQLAEAYHYDYSKSVKSGRSFNGTGPLGPFTGYATILKSSRFLKPAQEILNEFCNINIDGSRVMLMEQSEDHASISASIALEMAEREAKAVGCEDPHKVDFQQNKAKLQYLQEEVCRMYKQYHQQMQMVVSSFEAVVGLSDATPYVSFALKKVSNDFSSIKNAISDHVKLLIDGLGEEFPSTTTGTSSSKSDTSFSRVKYMNQSNAGLCRPHVWRPQRGLPERAVAVLRAWLFEHFLHPYPTDTDKLMLATKTGLSRNQVSNWFINARVRLWKPMVEEVHMLETKGFSENNPNHGKNSRSAAEFTSGAKCNAEQQYSNKLGKSSMLDRRQLECWGGSEHDYWQSQEKRSRVECQVSTIMDGSLMGFLPYQRSGGIDIGELGAVSLTLGLRHGTDGAQLQEQLQQQEDELRRLVC
ncbi:BEL1-like homeodomain protein 8 [Tripterygium wilfordii]|uniref:BEL1-like homeodomain protein 8 n=1 Tax=Tripterygium wilfordii TaxID=458696 RepID=UPI0018F842D1|nr:BEL1-like homeodomain protein 8 [Tripterygium wilfordii]